MCGIMGMGKSGGCGDTRHWYCKQRLTIPRLGKIEGFARVAGCTRALTCSSQNKKTCTALVGAVELSRFEESPIV